MGARCKHALTRPFPRSSVSCMQEIDLGARIGLRKLVVYRETVLTEAGEPLVVPLWHKSQAATRSHYQTVTARVPDAPRADEVVIVGAASTGPRPHPRIGDRTTDPAITSKSLESVLS